MGGTLGMERERKVMNGLEESFKEEEEEEEVIEVDSPIRRGCVC